MPADKVRENRLRRVARRRGLILQKSPRRDPRTLDYERWWIWNSSATACVSPDEGLTLDEVEAWLEADRLA